MTYTLHRPGWTNHTWVPHGTAQPIRFNADDVATVDADVFDEWIGDDKARVMGMIVTKPEPAPEPDVSDACPTCGATGDEPCRKPSGQTAKRHKTRDK